jgi:hypothetical protein
MTASCISAIWACPTQVALALARGQVAGALIDFTTSVSIARAYEVTSTHYSYSWISASLAGDGHHEVHAIVSKPSTQKMLTE